MTPRRRAPASIPAPPSVGSAECRSRLDALLKYLDDELTDAQAAVLERHLQKCVCCERLAASLRQAMDFCRAAGSERLPRDVQRRARARIRRLLNRAD